MPWDKPVFMAAIIAVVGAGVLSFPVMVPFEYHV